MDRVVSTKCVGALCRAARTIASFHDWRGFHASRSAQAVAEFCGDLNGSLVEATSTASDFCSESIESHMVHSHSAECCGSPDSTSRRMAIYTGHFSATEMTFCVSEIAGPNGPPFRASTLGIPVVYWEHAWIGVTFVSRRITSSSPCWRFQSLFSAVFDATFTRTTTPLSSSPEIARTKRTTRNRELYRPQCRIGAACGSASGGAWVSSISLRIIRYEFIRYDTRGVALCGIPRSISCT